MWGDGRVHRQRATHLEDFFNAQIVSGRAYTAGWSLIYFMLLPSVLRLIGNKPPGCSFAYTRNSPWV